MNNNRQMLSLFTRIFRPTLTLNYQSQSAWTILRIVAGIVIVHNGLDKLSNIESFAEAYVAYIGLPFPITLSYLAAFAELIGGPLLALGLLARPAALTLFSTMCVAMYHHILTAGFVIPYLELSMLYAACFLFFTINGAGLFSVDALIAGWLNDRAIGTQLEELEPVKSEIAANR